MSIRFEKVSKAFGKKSVLRNLSFEVKKGEILFILGKSGVGKSVTLKQIIGLSQPDSGHIFVDDQDVNTLSPTELPQVRRKCGIVFQHPALFDSMNVYENLSFGLRTAQYNSTLSSPLTEPQIDEIVRKNLALVHLKPEILDRFPSEISYGMQKRVSLARTLAPEPRYLLFDEPTTGLDPITTHAINDLIFDLSRRLKVTSVVVSHDMSCALKIADRILVIEQGEILEQGTVQEMKASKKPMIQEFLAEALESLTFLPPGQA